MYLTYIHTYVRIIQYSLYKNLHVAQLGPVYPAVQLQILGLIQVPPF